MAKATEGEQARFTLRLPASLREAIGQAAKRERRSVSNWILNALADAVAQSEAKAKSGK